MALSQSIKAPKKTAPKKRDPLFADEKYTGTEPAWDTERALTMSSEEFDHFLRKSFSYYNYYYTQKDLKKHMVKWAQDNGYSKKDVSAFNRSSDKAVPMTAYGILMAHKQGMPLRERELTYLKKQIDSAITSAEPEQIEEVVETLAAKPMTIQDRLNEKTSEQLSHFEGLYDEVVQGATVDPKAFDYLTANSVPQSQIKKFEDLFSYRKSELEAAQGKTSADHVEAYKHYKAADFKRHLTFLNTILEALEQYRGVKKATKKLRVKRAPDKQKLVSKVKYQKEEKTLKLVSINPVDIIGATSLWVYNTKTRKIGVYRADSLTGPLGIKGTTITGFDEVKSVSKTLRKPDEQLREFAKAGKVALRKFLDDIRATEVKLTGRLNEDIILLKAE